MNKHFYIIGMPGKIHFLDLCIELTHKKANLFIILNGVRKKEKKTIKDKYPNIPLFELATFCGSSISHGEVINLLLQTNEKNFGLIDHDLFIYNGAIFDQLDFQDDEYIAGPYKLHNKLAGITFPATFFLYINTKIVKSIMKKYGIGAQIYAQIPSKLLPILNKMNLGYDNFLKDYLNYFDPFNMIFSLAHYEGFQAKFLETKKEDLLHLGGKATDALKKKPERTKQLIKDIQSKRII